MIGTPQLNDPHGTTVQFRYAFAVDRDGLKVFDVADLVQPKPIANALVALEDAVLGRRSVRPLNRDESQSLYLKAGQLYTVEDGPAKNPWPLSGDLSLFLRQRYLFQHREVAPFYCQMEHSSPFLCAFYPYVASN